MTNGVSTPHTSTYSPTDTARTHDVEGGQSAQATAHLTNVHPATPPKVVRTSSEESPKLSSTTEAATAKAAGNLSEAQAKVARESSNSTNQDIAAGASSFVAQAQESFENAEEIPELKSKENIKEHLAACMHVINKLAAQIEELKSVRHNNPTYSPDSPGKEKTLASSIKKMFKNVGSVGATGLMVFSGVAFSLALITGQVYALPLLAMMTAVGYAATHLLLEDEEKEHQVATNHAA